MTAEQTVRLDKWLWAARFFKTRSLASKAVIGGHVHVNGNRVKPAKTVQVGDGLRIRRGAEEFDVVVLELRSRRGPAVVARSLYRETEESIQRRELQARTRRLAEPSGAPPSRRPDKRDRRKIRKFILKD
ncbi:MAG: RNA-binding S4 domain-containing protein [Desulfobulbaceae bacterium]|jgi:ribosome-associated heat shock protein Hsp15|nr:RNA-binding S4 domain-containing protein [Desulfobulbaceae bacterium]MDY0350857.1 RNA-binding S4 domain-containing protein [Desulfobulbaceae bacterium]